MKVAVVRFPGSNCDEDTYRALERAGARPEYLWHREESLPGFDAVVLPGGFSYGDYLRAGAIARFSPIMPAVVEFAVSGGPVLGICNGFQILCEVGLLAGALMRNAGLTFLSLPVEVSVETNDTPWTGCYDPGERVVLPIAHGDGRYVASTEQLNHLEAEGLVVMRYRGLNPNGSANDIAGITNQNRNVVGIMPHPERAAEAVLRNSDGAKFFDSLTRSQTAIGGTP